MKHSLIALILAAMLGLTAVSSAQKPLVNGSLTLSDGVKPHRGLDDLYGKFSRAYQRLDPFLAAEIYTESSAYLPPGTEIMTGRSNVQKSFASFFDSVRSRKGSLQISFNIVQRSVSETMAYDVGIFTLVQQDEKGEKTTGNGKFVVVAVKEKTGLWRFQVDAYNDLPKSRG